MLIKQERENFWILNWLDEFMIGHKGFICGGCFKNIFCHEKAKDLDIFFECRGDFDSAVNYFDSMSTGYMGEDKGNEEYVFYYENPNVKAYKHIKTGMTVELCCNIFGTAADILNQFDFTIVKFAYYKEEVDDETGEVVDRRVQYEKAQDKPETHIEYKVLHDDKFFEHLHLKRLVIDKEAIYPMSTFERMFRYAKYGYFPCKETKLKIIDALRALPEEQVKLSKSLYDGVD